MPRTATELRQDAGGVHHAPPRFSRGLGALLFVALLVMIASLWRRTRRAALRAWRSYAQEIDGEFSSRGQMSPAYVSGKLGERALFLSTQTAFDEEAPYYHTRSSMPIGNQGCLILGLRRKSLLEEAQMRGDSPRRTPSPAESGDSPHETWTDEEFERRFVLLCNAPEYLSAVLSLEVRRELSRYTDIEVYVRLKTIEWRRAGEQADLSAIHRLNTLLASLADVIDALPPRTLPLSQRLADAALIEKGI